MRNDLLAAEAAVNWAITQFDILKGRIDAWIESRPYVAGTHKDPQTGQESWQIDESQPIPLLINAEVGAIINSMRSSLDILVNALAERNCHIDPKDVRFPFSQSAAAFTSGKHPGREAIKRLSAAHQTTIEGLQPYHGGRLNHLLFTLHNMDIVRKHRRLVRIRSFAGGVAIYRFGSHPELDAAYRQQMPEKGYFLAFSPTHPDYYVQVRLEVKITEAGDLSGEPIIEALTEFAKAAREVIGMFNSP